MKPKLLAIVGSHRKNGNSYWLAKTVLDAVEADSSIIQLADKDVRFCNLCEECIEKDCVINDDVGSILGEMRKADGIVFVIPKYLDAPSKFLAFLERLDTIVHIRRHKGYAGPPKNPDYVLFADRQPFCVFALSGRGRVKKCSIRTVTEYIQSLGLSLVSHDYPPLLAVNVKAGDEKGDVLKNKRAVEQCVELAQKVVASTKRK
jgi:multimeric flavodoxin WrbA